MEDGAGDAVSSVQNQCCCSAIVQKSGSVSFGCFWSQTPSLLILWFFRCASFRLPSPDLLSYSMPLLWAQWIFQSDGFIIIIIFFLCSSQLCQTALQQNAFWVWSLTSPSRNKSPLHFSSVKGEAIASSPSCDIGIESSFVGMGCWVPIDTRLSRFLGEL